MCVLGGAFLTLMEQNCFSCGQQICCSDASLPNVTSLTRVLIGGVGSGGGKQINRHRFNSLLSSARLLAEVVRVNISILHSSWEATFQLCSDSSAEDGTRRLTLPISAKGHAAFMGAIKTCSCQERHKHRKRRNTTGFHISAQVLYPEAHTHSHGPASGALPPL